MPRTEASNVSAVTKQVDTEVARFVTRPLTEGYAYLVLNARYERALEKEAAG